MNKAPKAPQTHKQTEVQKLAKKLGVRASRSQPLRDLGYTDEDVDCFASKVPLLAKRLELRRSEASFEVLEKFATVNKQGIKDQVAQLKRLIAERDGEIKPSQKTTKRAWQSAPSSILTSLFGGGVSLPDFSGIKSRQIRSGKPVTVVAPAIRTPRTPTRNPNLKGAIMAKGESRERLRDKFQSNKSLDCLRTKTWFEYLLSATSPDAIDQYLQAHWLNALVSYFSQEDTGSSSNIESADQAKIPDLKLIFENWLIEQLESNPDLPGIPNNLYERRYESGREIPTLRTIALFDSFVPGSREVYEQGLYELPIWPVLSGDQTACKSFVNAHLPHEGLFQSFDQKFDSLINELIPYYAIPDPTSLKSYIESVCTGANLKNSLSKVAHPALVARIESIYAIVENRPTNTAYESSEDEDDLYEASNGRDTFTVDQIAELPTLVLVAFAMLKICSVQRSGPILQLEWLVMGLCCGLYSDLFTGDIQEYILEDIRMNGDVLTKYYEEQGISIIPFDQRWSSYGLY